jgi:lysozyme-like protein
MSRNSRRAAVALIAAIAVPAGIVAADAAADAATVHLPVARTAVEVCGTGAALVRPHSMILTCADDGELAEHLHWSSWTRTSATASGTVTWRTGTAALPDSRHWHSTAAQFTLTRPVVVHGRKLYTRLRLHVTGSAPRGFMRNLTFDETPVAAKSATAKPAGQGPSSTRKPLAGRRPATSGAPPSGTLSYANIEGYWIAAGGPSSEAETAAAITGAESSFEPGIIQQGVDYCGTAPNEAGWGLWQITCGNSEPSYGTDFQILDPWNSAEAAVAKYDAAGDSFSPWTTYTSGAYESYEQSVTPATGLTDPGQYTQAGSTPSGTPASPSAAPGSTYGPAMPGSQPAPAFETVFNANGTGDLELDTIAGNHTDTGLGMAAGTSPAIAWLSGGGWEAAFRANGTGDLELYSSATGQQATTLGVTADTSPAIAALTGGGYEVVFNANGTGDLEEYSSSAGQSATTLGLAAGTSPAIAGLTGGGWEAVFNANGTGDLEEVTSAGNHASSGLGMATGTSPAIAGLTGGG